MENDLCVTALQGAQAALSSASSGMCGGMFSDFFGGSVYFQRVMDTGAGHLGLLQGRTVAPAAGQTPQTGRPFTLRLTLGPARVEACCLQRPPFWPRAPPGASPLGLLPHWPLSCPLLTGVGGASSSSPAWLPRPPLPLSSTPRIRCFLSFHFYFYFFLIFLAF